MKGAPRSKIFDDVYFSAEDGLAETRHVFLAGNNLPDAWEGRERFPIAETGFGTGLNFLAAWKLFAETATPGQSLEFISFEKYPLSAAEISDALTDSLSLEGEGRGEGGDDSGLYPPHPNPLPVGERGYESYLEGMVALYPEGGKVAENVTLRLIIGDVNEELPKLQTPVDCWFLDGFRPSSNPEMWTDTVFENMARLTVVGGTFATFTSAGFVRRGLQAAGFEVSKIPGFGRKREMSVGRKP